ncbi:YlxR family protein [Glycomyces buryatensis]|uniref:YlxR family protein n=1 Tax=Glycomyces buryatensis TaxID=2570927 RepID=A0A4S8QJ03_9ACTN|nr:YlxR family protein [Glycomyces buryatensis]
MRTLPVGRRSRPARPVAVVRPGGRLNIGSQRDAAVIRTCVGCRGRAAALELLRVVVQRSEGSVNRLVPDPKRRLSGRGAHVHHDLNCLDQAVRKRAFSRALRVEGPVDDAAVRALVESESAERSAPAHEAGRGRMKTTR